MQDQKMGCQVDAHLAIYSTLFFKNIPSCLAPQNHMLDIKNLKFGKIDNGTMACRCVTGLVSYLLASEASRILQADKLFTY